jgi:hypothetical protein
VGLANRLGNDVDGRQGQCLFMHRRLNGTIQRYTFGGGRMYLWDGASTYTEITPVGITIDRTNPMFVRVAER